MDRPTTGGSIRRARERAQAGEAREDFATFARRMAQTAQSQQGQQQQQQRQQPQKPISQSTQQRIPIPSSARRELAGDVSPPSKVSLQTKDGQIGVAISRPVPAPQWPLAGPLAAPSNLNGNGGRNASANDTDAYRPPPGRSQAPQRPPRPSRVPSILDSSKIQDPIPTVFGYNAGNQAGADAGSSLQVPDSRSKTNRESDLSMTQQSSASSISRASTVSSVGSIPDFPVPVAVPVAIPVPAPVVAMPPPRRSVNLGPPPSARRGASSFYSNASYVSPIPEESPRSRSHASFASSAAMPDNWGSSSSLAMSPNYADATSFYEDIPEESRESSNASGYDDEDGSRSGAGSAEGDRDADEKNLVRSASIGKRGKAALVTTPGTRGDARSPFREGTGYLDGSSSSSAITAQTNKATAGSSLTADNILDAYDAATATDPSNPNRRSSVSPQPPFASFGNTEFGPERPYNRLSAIRRPPRLDIEAVRKAEARGSLTSLPDLIRRATRLAASLDRGRRPASRIDDLNMSPGIDGRGVRASEVDTEKHQSGLSDMLAAFPPPAQPNRRSFRQSLREQVGSWPLPLNINNGSRLSGQPIQADGESISDLTDLKNQRSGKGRRCCGLPLWGFVMIVIVILIIIAAAVVIPLEFFVIRKQNTGSNSALAKCQSQITCANGGTNVVSTQGVCSCICTNDFTGFDCSVAGDNGCTTTTLASSASTSSLANVTLGNALPRLIEQAQQNFSIPLSGTQILAVFNSGNLSCASENALVTFDGETTRQSSSGSTVVNAFLGDDADSDGYVSVVSGVAIITVTVEASAAMAKRANGFSTIVTAPAGSSADADQVFPTQSGTTLMISTQITPSIVSPTSTTTVTTTITPTRTTSGTETVTGSGSSASATATFKVTEDVLDFARVAVLFILQQDTLANAELAQSDLQRFFTQASASSLTNGQGVSVDKATNVTLGNNNSINLVQFQVNAANTLRGVGISA
ncbi:hypothetical protein SEUCBS139899_010313 [Sporothrix eucalyptigena]|uniref:EGF-like domain-containing protein n=1 Tax=Sporothrix eucalyptigena TaxID=1812306 RepID=A0ABP0D078_9PEZI